MKKWKKSSDFYAIKGNVQLNKLLNLGRIYGWLDQLNWWILIILFL